MLPKILIGVIIILILGVAGYFTWDLYFKEKPAQPIVVQENPPQEEVPNTYASSTMKISVQYPKDFHLQEKYAYDKVNPNKLINGVKFNVPVTMATGTNLSVDSGISIEQLPRATKCAGDIYLKANVRSIPVTDAGVNYSVATSSEGSAGNRYEEIVFAIASSSPCTAVRYFIHSTNLENYDPGTIRAYDAQALYDAFDEIRRSLRLTQ